MSQTLQNQILSAKSMNGIITLSDGAGTTISNGKVVTNDLSGNTMSVSNLSLGSVDLKNALKLEQFDTLSTPVGNVSLWEKGNSYFSILPQSNATPTNTTDLVTLSYTNSNYGSLSGTNNWVGQNTFSKLTYSNVSSSISITNYDFANPLYPTPDPNPNLYNEVYLQYSGNGTYTGYSGWIFSELNDYSIYIIHGNGNFIAYTTYMPTASQQALMILNLTAQATAATTIDYSLVAGEYVLTFQLQTNGTQTNMYMDCFVVNSSTSAILTSLTGITPATQYPNWVTYSMAFSLPTTTNVKFQFVCNVSNQYCLLCNLQLTLDNCIVVSDGSKTATIGGSQSILNGLYVTNGLNVTNGATISGGLSSNSTYGNSNCLLNSTLGSSSSTNAFNTALGNSAMNTATSSLRCIAIGNGCNNGATSQLDSIFIGSTFTGGYDGENRSVIIGNKNAPCALSTGDNVLVGYNIGDGRNGGNVGSRNVILGSTCFQRYNGYGDLSPSYNTCLGYNSNYYSADNYNTSLGAYTLYNMCGSNGVTSNGNNGYTTQYNVAIGYNAAYTYSRYNNCSFLGSQSDTSADNLTNATAIGYNCKVGTSNTIQLGSNSEIVAISGDLKSGTNTITATQLGYLSSVSTGLVDRASNQTINGTKTFSSLIITNPLNITPVSYTVQILNGSGGNVLRYNSGWASTAIGPNALAVEGTTSVTPNSNMAIGNGALQSAAGCKYCTAIGNSALSAYTGTGNFNHNTAVGYNALSGCTTGIQNTAIGSGSGVNVSSSGGSSSYCTYIGYLSGQNTTAAVYNYSTAIGYGAQITGSNQVVIGTSTETHIIPSAKIRYGGAYQPNSVYQTITGALDWNTSPPTTLPHYILFSMTGSASVNLTLPAISNANIFEGMEFIFRRTNTAASATTTSILSALPVETDVIYIAGAMTSIVQPAVATILGNGAYYGKLVCINKSNAPYAWAYFPS